MTPENARAARSRLEAAAERLRDQSPTMRLAALGRVLDAWSDAGSEVRHDLLDAHPRASGLSRETVAAGLERALAGWNAAALERMVERELGSVAALEKSTLSGVTTVIHGGVLPMPTLVDLLAPLVLGSPVFSKPAARDPVTPRLLAASLDAFAPELAGCVEIADLHRADAAALAPLLEVARVVATGSDEAIEAIRERIPTGTRLIAHGHKLSVAVLGDDRGPPLRECAALLAVDVALWDQLGCLSPVACYVLGDHERADVFAAELAKALEAREGAWPRGEIDAAAATDLAHERADAELRAAAGRAVTLRSGETAAWTVVTESDAAPRTAVLHRFVRIHPVPNEEAATEAILGLQPHLTGVAVAGFHESGEAIRSWASKLGASRVAPFGELQAPPLHWARDGLGPLRSLFPDDLGQSPVESAENTS